MYDETAIVHQSAMYISVLTQICDGYEICLNFVFDEKKNANWRICIARMCMNFLLVKMQMNSTYYMYNREGFSSGEISYGFPFRGCLQQYRASTQWENLVAIVCVVSL